MTIKTTIISHYQPTRMANIKPDDLTSVGKDMEKLELSYIFGESVKWHNHFEKVRQLLYAYHMSQTFHTRYLPMKNESMYL